MLDTIAYYDASGRQDDATGVLAVVGVVASEDRWTSFEQEWEAVLNRFGAPYFHAVEFSHSRNAFEHGWKGDAPKRGQFLAALLEVAGRRVEHIAVVGVKMEAFHAINRDYLLAEQFGDGHAQSGAYVVAARYCLAYADEWIKDNHPGKAFGHVFEAGDDGQAAFRAGIARAPIANALAFKKKIDAQTGRRVRPFEAADLAASEWRRFYDQSFPSTDTAWRRTRASFHALNDRVSSEGLILEEDNLMGLVQDHGVKKR